MTAVEWLQEQITFDADGERWASFIDCYDLSEFFNKAIEMEKQQIMESGNTCALRMRILCDKIETMTTDEILAEADKKDGTLGEQYYNETFNKQTL